LLALAFGFDEDVLARLSTRARDGLQRVAWTGVFSTFLCGFSAAYGAMLATGSAWAGLGAAAFCMPFVWNLHRLLIAGTGVPLDQPPSATLHWRPGNAPLLAFGVFAVIAGQPMLLLVDGGAHDIEVEAHRGILADRHARTVLDPLQQRRDELALESSTLRNRLTLATRRLADTPPGDATPEKLAVSTIETTLGETTAALEAIDRRIEEVRTSDVDEYRAHLSTMTFPVLRLQLTWARPVSAGILSIAFACLILLPLFARRLGLGSFREYEFERHDFLRAVVEVEHLRWRAQMEPVVTAYPGWSPLAGPFAAHVRRSQVEIAKVTGRALLERINGRAAT